MELGVEVGVGVEMGKVKLVRVRDAAGWIKTVVTGVEH